jgi:hypothetical protein
LKIIYLLLFALTVSTQASTAEQRVPGCDDLKWSAQLLEANPDIRESCLGVYVRNNKFYARSQIELVRVNPGSLLFRPVHRDGKLGPSRRIKVPNSWRANIGGKAYRLIDLTPGQRLSVYIPEDRFALAIDNDDDNFDGDADLMNIDSADRAADDSEQ